MSQFVVMSCLPIGATAICMSDTSLLHIVHRPLWLSKACRRHVSKAAVRSAQMPVILTQPVADEGVAATGIVLSPSPASIATGVAYLYTRMRCALVQEARSAPTKSRVMRCALMCLRRQLTTRQTCLGQSAARCEVWLGRICTRRHSGEVVETCAWRHVLDSMLVRVGRIMLELQ